MPNADIEPLIRSRRRRVRHLSPRPLNSPAPTTVVHKLHDEIEKALQLLPVREKLATLGVEEQLLTVEQFYKFVSDDMAATLSLAKSAHLEPEN